ncbi:SMI1/KNR4 family protein [Streptomyces sp. NPDC001910]|uniref:SMI1/KNR4 family protein n=1 Tax=Streptomyces sp. NPDC001910 TaxID=3154403 RepID=UPI003318CF37
MAQFEEVKTMFWGAGSYGVQPPLTDEVIAEAERTLGVVLPSSLLDLLRVQNGGEVSCDRDAYPSSHPTSWSTDHVPFGDLMGFGHRSGVVSVLDTSYLVEEWDLPSPIVLISGNGHHWIALDYRECGRQGSPAVAWLEADSGMELQLAADFCSFVEGLTASAFFH